MDITKYQLPWRTERPHQDIPGVVYVSGRFPGSIATVYCAGPGTSQEKNAEFIVKAANVHHQLVEALAKARNALLEHGDVRTMAPAVEAIDTALAAAEAT